MGRKKKTKRQSPKPKPFYDLVEVQQKIKDRQYIIRKNALDGAWGAFGWGVSSILDALMRLQPKHFFKSDVARYNPKVVFDFYKAYGLKYENVYVHFYINDQTDTLIINSFKKI